MQNFQPCWLTWSDIFRTILALKLTHFAVGLRQLNATFLNVRHKSQIIKTQTCYYETTRGHRKCEQINKAAHHTCAPTQSYIWNFLTFHLFLLLRFMCFWSNWIKFTLMAEWKTEPESCSLSKSSFGLYHMERDILDIKHPFVINILHNTALVDHCKHTVHTSLWQIVIV